MNAHRATRSGDERHDDRLSVEQAAARLGVSLRTVYRWIERHGLPVEGAGDRGSLRVDAAALDRWASHDRPGRRRTPATEGDVVEHVLRAASRVLAHDGATSLTVERVADEAGMSVGGVTYHFATKSSLVEGLFDRFVARFESAWRLAEDHGLGVADAYVTVSLGPDDDAEGARAILVAASALPELRTRIDRQVRRWYRRIEASAEDPDEALRRCLAVDAVWLFGLLGARPVPSARVRRVVGSPIG